MLPAEGARPQPQVRAEALVYDGGALQPVLRRLVVEEPLTIRLGDRILATLMRTPGHEEDLALGFLLTEGIISSTRYVGAIAFCPSGELGRQNEARVTLVAQASPVRMPSPRRVFSSCGLCGRDMIDEVAADLSPFEQSASVVAPDDIFELARSMQAGQTLFRATGATHAAAIGGPGFPEPIIREDIGRHNALDKAVGAAARAELPLSSAILVLSGRLSFEMIAKAAHAGISRVAGVSAPSGLAVELARKLNMFLAGFVRNGTMTVYAGSERLRP